MKIKEFIKSNLEQLSKRCSGVKLSYVYDDKYNQHIVVVSPSASYKSEYLAKILLEFESNLLLKFPNEDFTFLPEDSDIKLPTFEYVFENVAEIKSSQELLKRNYFEINILLDSIELFDKNMVFLSDDVLNNFMSSCYLMTYTSTTQNPLLSGLEKATDRGVVVEDNSYAMAA